MVIPVPLAATVERDDQQVVAFEILEHPGRLLPADDGVAQRPAHPVEDRRTDEEVRLGGREPRQQLGPQVVVDQAVVAAEAEAGRRRAGLDRQCGQIQTSRPALGTPYQLVDLGGGHLGAGQAQQRGRFGVVHREVVDADLDDPAVDPQPGQRERHGIPRRDGEPPAGRYPERELGDRRRAVGAGDLLDVVEHDQHRRAQRADRLDQPGYDVDAATGRGQHSARVPADRLDLVEGVEDARPQRDRVVVGAFARHPGHPRPEPLDPLGQHSRLAVAGWRHHGDHRLVRFHQAIDNCGPRNQPLTRTTDS